MLLFVEHTDRSHGRWVAMEDNNGSFSSLVVLHVRNCWIEGEREGVAAEE